MTIITEIFDSPHRQGVLNERALDCLMATKKKTILPEEIPDPGKLREIPVPDEPGEPINPDIDPDIIPEEDPVENPPPFEIPEPGEGP